jgi:hypothetical protein
LPEAEVIVSSYVTSLTAVAKRFASGYPGSEVLTAVTGNTPHLRVWGGRKTFSSAGMKVPRQCPLFLLVKVILREGKGLGSEKGKVLGCGVCHEQRREVELGLHCV